MRRPLRGTVTLSAAWLPGSEQTGRPAALSSSVTSNAPAPRGGRPVVRLGSAVPARSAAPTRTAPPTRTAAPFARQAPRMLLAVVPSASSAAALPGTSSGLGTEAPVRGGTVARGTPVRWKADGPARLVWTGFKARDGAAEVALQVTKPLTPRVVERPGHLLLVLPQCRLQGRLASQPLDTRFFAGAVDGVVPKQRGHNVEIDVRLRHEIAAAAPQRQEGPRGSSLWVLALPAASADASSATVATLFKGRSHRH